MTAARLINKSMWLYGPGPVMRKPAGLGSRPPLQGLVLCACQATVISLTVAFSYRIFVANPETKAIEEYYKENPPH